MVDTLQHFEVKIKKESGAEYQFDMIEKTASLAIGKVEDYVNSRGIDADGEIEWIGCTKIR